MGVCFKPGKFFLVSALAHGCLTALTTRVLSTVTLRECAIVAVPARVTWAIVCEIKWWAYVSRECCIMDGKMH